MRQYVHFLHIVRWPWKLLLNHVIFAGCDQACSAFTSNKETRSPERIMLFCLFVACSYKSMKTTALPSSFSWILYGMPKVLRYSKLPISLERVEWFCWCFACGYVHMAAKIWDFGQVMSGMSSQPMRVPDILNLKNSKTILVFTLVFCM